MFHNPNYEQQPILRSSCGGSNDLSFNATCSGFRPLCSHTCHRRRSALQLPSPKSSNENSASWFENHTPTPWFHRARCHITIRKYLIYNEFLLANFRVKQLVFHTCSDLAVASPFAVCCTWEPAQETQVRCIATPWPEFCTKSCKDLLTNPLKSRDSILFQNWFQFHLPWFSSWITWSHQVPPLWFADRLDASGT